MRVGEGGRLRDLRHEALTIAPEAFGATRAEDRPARWYEDLARGPGAVFVLGDWRGMMGVRIDDDEQPWLWGTWVTPAERRTGGGRRLLDAAIEWARVRGFETLHLEVITDAARALYEAGGFTGGRFMTLPLHPPPRRIDAERVVLREWRPHELAELHALRDHEAAVRWLYDEPATLEESRGRLHRRIHDRRFALTGDALGFAVERDGAIVGDASFFLHSAEHLQAELGYIVHPDHQGRGYATEAAGALLGFGFEALGLHRIFATIEPRNAASARVLERIGMVREALLVENEIVKGEWQSEAIYAARATASRGA